MSGIERKAIREGFAYYIPLRYSELPGYYRDWGIKTLDVAMFQVRPWMSTAGSISAPAVLTSRRYVSAPRR